jgi:hypothetical protein
LLYDTAIQHDGSRGKIQRFVARVRTHQHGATVFAQRFEGGTEPDEALTVKSGGGFVKQEKPRSMQKCSRDG